MSKINDIQNRSIDNRTAIIRQISNNKNMADKVTLANLTQYNNNIIHTIDTGFEFMNMFIGENYPDGDQLRQYIKFETILNNFDEKLIPYINISIIYEQNGNNVDDYAIPGLGTMLYNPRNFITGYREADYTGLRSSNKFQIEDIIGSDLKQVKIISALYIANGFAPLPRFKAKLLITFYNPTDFSRIN